MEGGNCEVDKEGFQTGGGRERGQECLESRSYWQQSPEPGYCSTDQSEIRACLRSISYALRRHPRPNRKLVSSGKCTSEWLGVVIGNKGAVDSSQQRLAATLTLERSAASSVSVPLFDHLSSCLRANVWFHHRDTWGTRSLLFST